MPSKRSFYKSIDFWIVSTILGISVFYLCLCEIFPTDWFMSSSQYKEDPNFIYEKKWNRLLIATKEHQCFESKSYLNNPDLLLQNIEYYYKNKTTRTTIALVEIEGFRYVVKRYNIPNFWRWIKALPIKASKAYRSWHFGLELDKLGIRTPKPLMLIEKRVGPFWTTSYLVTRYIPGLSGYDYFNSASSYIKQWPEALKELKELISQLNEHLIIHGDLTLNNLVIYHNKPYLIDLDRIHLYRYDHSFYQSRYRTQHLSKLNRKFKQVSAQAQDLFLDSFNLPSKGAE